MKHAIVTGGAGLIGAELCTALQMADYEVACFDIRQAPAGIRSFLCDVSDEAAVAAGFAELGWESLDLLVNNAGIASPDFGPITDLSLDQWRMVTDSHLTAAFLMTRAAVPLMGEGASIVNVLSTRAFMSEKNTEAYAASKGGLFGLTHALAVSLGPKIRVNGIAPGWITRDTDLRPEDHAQHPVGRVGRPEDVAKAVLYLASAGFVTGEVLTLDGGMSRKMIYAE
ncbi:short-chain dehydrogenase [Rhizobium sp. TH135]|uniref:SDR family NAD(P)-dependent oxidoreductase n=1 Tax=Rhizobium sp. TH135 TaxID=2067451 RepID=UPI000C7D4660|nr:SDR family oxidoreductase [Rhizobium sp. TH135]PLK72460.1 short-chain dehydrogenase [Rhizobium sp. TH135]